MAICIWIVFDLDINFLIAYVKILKSFIIAKHIFDNICDCNFSIISKSLPFCIVVFIVTNTKRETMHAHTVLDMMQNTNMHEYPIYNVQTKFDF